MRRTINIFLFITTVAYAGFAAASGRLPHHPRRPAPESAPALTLVQRLEAHLSKRVLIHWGMRLGLAVVFVGLYRSWRREHDGDEQVGRVRGFRGTLGAARHYARPVQLDHGGVNFDAAAVHDHLIERFGDEPASLRSVIGTPTMFLGDEPPPSKSGLSKSASAPESAANLADRLRGPGGIEDPWRLRAPELEAAANLPLGLREHFDRLPGESVEWSAAIAVHGRIAITTERVLAAYRQRTFALLPPSWTSGIRRSSIPLAAILRAEAGHQRRARFLALGLLGAVGTMWSPFALAWPVVSIGLFLFARRPVLALTTVNGGGTRRYPLPLDDSQEATRTLNHLKAQAGAAVKKGA